MTSSHKNTVLFCNNIRKVRFKSVAYFRFFLASGSQFSCFDQVQTDIQSAPKATHQLVNRYYTVSSATIARQQFCKLLHHNRINYIVYGSAILDDTV